MLHPFFFWFLCFFLQLILKVKFSALSYQSQVVARRPESHPRPSQPINGTMSELLLRRKRRRGRRKGGGGRGVLPCSSWSRPGGRQRSTSRCRSSSARCPCWGSSASRRPSGTRRTWSARWTRRRLGKQQPAEEGGGSGWIVFYFTPRQLTWSHLHNDNERQLISKEWRGWKKQQHLIKSSNLTSSLQVTQTSKQWHQNLAKNLHGNSDLACFVLVTEVISWLHYWLLVHSRTGGHFVSHPSNLNNPNTKH